MIVHSICRIEATMTLDSLQKYIETELLEQSLQVHFRESPMIVASPIFSRIVVFLYGHIFTYNHVCVKLKVYL